MRRRFASAVVVAAGVGLWLIPAAAAASEWPLSGYWPMYEGRGQVVHDISGRGNHGRLGSPEDASAWYEGAPLG
jgi:hypothetical protein